MDRGRLLHSAVGKAVLGGAVVEPEAELRMIGAFHVLEHRQFGAEEIE